MPIPLHRSTSPPPSAMQTPTSQRCTHPFRPVPLNLTLNIHISSRPTLTSTHHARSTPHTQDRQRAPCSRKSTADTSLHLRSFGPPHAPNWPGILLPRPLHLRVPSGQPDR